MNECVTCLSWIFFSFFRISSLTVFTAYIEKLNSISFTTNLQLFQFFVHKQSLKFNKQYCYCWNIIKFMRFVKQVIIFVCILNLFTLNYTRETVCTVGIIYQK